MTIETSTLDAPAPLADGAPQPAPLPAPLAALPALADRADGVDPYDYAESIVQDVALHVGARLRDFRSDVAAMQAAVQQLPDTLRVHAMAQGLQELRERLAHLTSVVSQQVTRYPEELERVGKALADLTNRIAGMESWIAVARQTVAQGQASDLPLPTGGFVGQQQFETVVGQVHESVLRVVGAVRDLQLDLRDLRTTVRDQGPDGDPFAASPELARLNQRVADLDARLDAATDPAVEATRLATLVFGTWGRLAQPAGAEALDRAVELVLRTCATRTEHTVRLPQTPGSSGIVAVCTGRGRQGDVVALVATEDLGGRDWTLGPQGADLRPADGQPPAARTACWRALLASAALVEQTRPGSTVVPVLVYGNGALDAVPSRADLVAHGQSIGATAAAHRLVAVAADGLTLPGLGSATDVGAALAEV